MKNILLLLTTLLALILLLGCGDEGDYRDLFYLYRQEAAALTFTQ